ncbi:alpha-N-acetylglucosaminidase [Roseibacillus persicicus]|nr:alpha-N-acetylglucosaminidase [Roseibacillus persicicus]
MNQPLFKYRLFALLCVFMSAGLFVRAAEEDAPTIAPATELISRVLPAERVDEFVLELIPSPDGKDVYEVESQDGKLVVRGNTGVAIASGLNWYLKEKCNSQVSMNHNQISLPKPLPLVENKVRVETPFEYRYLFNYCTYGYSMPWWDWEKWEEMIDYMAFMGVNMPLAMIGQEAVWQEVYRELGMTDEQLDKFFVGPAHLPWGWMGNIDGLGGPLPQDWISQRAELQKKILARMRSLGMKPVLQAFTGHVPVELKEIYPEAEITQIHDWAGIPGTMFLSPTDPLFTRIGTLFIEKQTEMFGTNHLYDADCFIEVDPPSKDPAYLSEVSKTVYDSMVAADPEAIWVLQGWFFFFRSEFWQPEQGRAFVGGVPKDKIIVLDLYGEKNTTWDKTESFFGQPWIWNVICNQDQKVNMSGHLAKMQTNFQTAYQSEIEKNLRGVGTIPEGVGYNPIVQDFIYELAWDQSEKDLEKWVSDYGKRRYGTKDERAGETWQRLLSSVYGRTRTDWGPLITTPTLQIFGKPKEDIRHVRKNVRITEENPFGQDYDVYELYEASQILLSMADDLQEVETYRFDLTNVHRELIYGLSYLVIDDLTQAYLSGEPARLKAAGDKLLGLLDDLEAVTGSHEMFLLGKWLEDAQSWATTEEEKAYYNWNARTIVSIWQPWKNGGLRDYASKQWNGMFSGYYKPRWELLIQMLEKNLEEGTDFDAGAFNQAVREVDFAWTHAQDEYPSKPTTDPVEEAWRIQKKYQKYFLKK